MTNPDGKQLKAEAEEVQVGAVATALATARLTVTRGPDSWQFFAFVFAAIVTLVLGLLDDVPWSWPWWTRAAARVLAFVVLAYLLLVNARVRNWLVGVSRNLLTHADECPHDVNAHRDRPGAVQHCRRHDRTVFRIGTRKRRRIFEPGEVVTICL